ncbi:MAG TPA: NAD(P) transhydrogenase subunit alpha [Thermoanaerobaculia bacterium]|nr:NAD(P) transhydrogenase subunit alpha [Thermoanaerobaculia bacterium]
MLATFLGLEVIRKVSPLLHTPLMSLTNAISAIAVVGSIMIAGAKDATLLSRVLGFIAVTASTCNLVSGFLITDRMLKMFKKREPSAGGNPRAQSNAGGSPRAQSNAASAGTGPRV